MRRLTFVGFAFLILATRSSGAELLSGLDSVVVTLPNDARIGTISLAGEWLDTCVPHSISHSVTGTTIDVLLEHDGINVGCGDAITPWSLTEQLGTLQPARYAILGSTPWTRWTAASADSQAAQMSWLSPISCPSHQCWLWLLRQWSGYSPPES